MSKIEGKWHSVPIEVLLSELSTTLNGLSQAEAKERLKKYGSNKIPFQNKSSILQLLINQFHNVFIYILLFAAIITATLQHWIDTGVILSAVVLNALIGFLQEGKAERTIEALTRILSLKADVIRSNKRKQILSEDLVIGDIVLLHPGDQVPADLRLIKSNNLQVQESILTGESLPIEKNIQPIPEKTILAERTSMVFAGTYVTYGTGIGVVTAIGKSTEVGKISTLISHIPKLSTPLLQQMTIFARFLGIAILFFSIAIFLFGILIRHYPIDEMFLASVAIAVAAIPEGLPAIMTIILAIGVTRMAKRNAIIRRLPAVETLSAVTVICTDKTGTLTKNELTVNKIITPENTYEITGSGYNNIGHILLNNHRISLESHPDLEIIVRTGILCNEASLYQEDSSWQLHGSPIDGALLALALKTNMDHKKQANAYRKKDVFPFDSTHKFMASLYHDEADHSYLFVKGAAEQILAMCSSQFINSKKRPLDKSLWNSEINLLAQNRMRVIAFAYKETSLSNLSLKNLGNELIFLGVAGIIDPPREEVALAIKECSQAGIRVKMVTGDHRETAVAIGNMVGIVSEQTLTGDQIDTLDDNTFASIVNNIDIYARTTPEHKLRLIQALRKHHHIIAMTGDGANDAPALRHADIGVAMGKKGTDIAKEAAEIVLTDDNFSSITAAVKEARTVYENLKKLILFILPNDAAEGFSVLLAILFGYTLPISPLQILWVNLVTAVTLGLALAFESPEKNIMLHPPRDSNEPLFSKFLVWRIIFVSILVASSMFTVFIFAVNLGKNIELARTMVVNLLVMAEVFYLLNCRKIYDSVLNRDGLFSSKPILISIVLVIILQLGFTYFPFMQNIFKTVSMNLNEWSLILVISFTLFLIIEFEKMVMYKLKLSS